MLDAFGGDTSNLSLGELARRADLPKSTVHRIVGQLVQWGALERNGTGLRLGIRLFELGSVVSHQRELRDAAVPFMEDLYESTHETVHLGLLDRCEVVYVEKITGHRRVQVPTGVGRRMPCHCTGLGKAILAFSPPAVVDRVLRNGLRPRTCYTIVIPELLLEELDRVRAAGVAFDREESALGVNCAAAPIMNAAGVAIGAISVTGATSRLEPSRFASAVRTAALGLQRTLATPREPSGHTRGPELRPTQ